MQKSTANNNDNRNRAHVLERADQSNTVIRQAPFECNSEQQSMEKRKGSRRINNKLLDYHDAPRPEPRYFHHHVAWSQRRTSSKRGIDGGAYLVFSIFTQARITSSTYPTGISRVSTVVYLFVVASTFVGS